MDDRRFLPQYRIRRSGDFQRAMRRRISAADAWIVVFGCRNGIEHPRLGVSVSRRIGSAVARNRWKRLLREAFRHARPQLSAGLDLIVIPRAAAPPGLAVLRDSLVQLAGRVAKKLG